MQPLSFGARIPVQKIRETLVLNISAQNIQPKDNPLSQLATELGLTEIQADQVKFTQDHPNGITGAVIVGQHSTPFMLQSIQSEDSSGLVACTGEDFNAAKAVFDKVCAFLKILPPLGTTIH